MQAHLRDAVHAYSVWVRRQAALRETARRLEGKKPVSEEDRLAVLDAMDAELQERADRLAGSGR